MKEVGQQNIKEESVIGTDIRKVFICYASEDVDLLKDFVSRFKEHFGNIDLLFDAVPYSGNLHTRFRSFAKECQMAILLVSARFTNLKSYASQYEVPILIDRQKKHQVTIVGVLFSDVDVEEWNKEGDVYFFQLRNNDLANTRRMDENGDEFNRQYAVYEIINKKDRNTYHKKLATWVKDAVGSTAQKRANNIHIAKARTGSETPNAKDIYEFKTPKNKPIPSSKSNKKLKEKHDSVPRDTTQSKNIIGKIFNPFLEALETQLSMSNDYWNGFELSPEEKNHPLLPAFFERQRNRIITARQHIESLDGEANGLIGNRLKNILPEIEKVQLDVSNLLQAAEVKDVSMERILTRFENRLKSIRSSLKLSHREDINAQIRNEHLPDLFDDLENLSEKMNDLDREMYSYMRN